MLISPYSANSIITTMTLPNAIVPPICVDADLVTSPTRPS